MGAGRPVTDRWHNCRDGAGEERESPLFGKDLSEVVVNLRNS